jgi:hypothetical protein
MVWLLAYKRINSQTTKMRGKLSRSENSLAEPENVPKRRVSLKTWTAIYQKRKRLMRKHINI